MDNVEKYYGVHHDAVVLGGEVSVFLSGLQAVPQGSPTLFWVFTNDVLQGVEAAGQGAQRRGNELSGILLADDFVGYLVLVGRDCRSKYDEAMKQAWKCAAVVSHEYSVEEVDLRVQIESPGASKGGPGQISWR